MAMRSRHQQGLFLPRTENQSRSWLPACGASQAFFCSDRLVVLCKWIRLLPSCSDAVCPVCMYVATCTFILWEHKSFGLRPTIMAFLNLCRHLQMRSSPKPQSSYGWRSLCSPLSCHAPPPKPAGEQMYLMMESSPCICTTCQRTEHVLTPQLLIFKIIPRGGKVYITLPLGDKPVVPQRLGKVPKNPTRGQTAIKSGILNYSLDFVPWFTRLRNHF